MKNWRGNANNFMVPRQNTETNFLLQVSSKVHSTPQIESQMRQTQVYFHLPLNFFPSKEYRPQKHTFRESFNNTELSTNCDM